MRPNPAEYNAYYATYISLVADGDVVQTMAQQHEATQRALAKLDEPSALFRPALGEWSVKQVIGHMLDTERLFAFRAMCFARADAQDLPGMEPDPWVAAANFDQCALADLLAEFAHLRAASVCFFRSLTDEMCLRGGKASGYHVTVRALAWMIAGHELHHMNSLREKYRVA